ncbi:uncharacterized protein LOC133797828 [Humulus lupulus]|uniref:uncharacterized protein LOC133797828 n=1 Tax=Humulus lupulus TaxID=3486 RepID=UPI002B417A97|nr:uncharacterized protein LOC133797828 [Humulus lupulus]
MVKGEDIERRKKNKANRKKLNRKDSSNSVSARVAAIIASKKRRKSGKRSQCQGMCFSPPTLDEPSQDKHGKKNRDRKGSNKDMSYKTDNKVSSKEYKDASRKPALSKKKKDASVNDLNGKVEAANSKTRLNGNGSVHDHQRKASSGCPSKYHIMCLNEIESALRQDGTNIIDEDKPFFASTWGIEFWKCYSAGKDVLETSGASSTVEKIAWIVSSAADTISKKDEEGLSYASPFLLFLVPSQEKATKVRSVCKPLKVHGIHTVSIHPGASLDHQIQGLKNCEPEFLISTPERLLELISLKAVDISGVSLLVIDGLEAHCRNGYVDSIAAITKSLSGNTRRLVFNDCVSSSHASILQKLITGPVHRLSLNDSRTVHALSSLQKKNKLSVEIDEME